MKAKRELFNIESQHIYKNVTENKIFLLHFIQTERKQHNLGGQE